MTSRLLKLSLTPLLLAVALGAAALALPAAAQAGTHVSVRIGPPAARVEVMPMARPGQVWAPGHYEWRRGRYHWVRGAWLQARPGHEWRPAVWVQRGGRWHYQAPHWYARPVVAHGPRPWADRDRDGVRNRWDGHPNNRWRY